LPVKPEELSKWILIGKVKLKAQIAAIKAITKIEDGFAAKEAALADTQDLAEELLYTEARLGEILETHPSHIGKMGGGSIKTLPESIDYKQSHYAKELSKNKDVIAQVVANAREKGEIPVRQHVLKAIQKAKPKPETPELPKGKFNVIYADPPWKYGDELIEGYGAVKHHYPSMTIEELCYLSVSRVTHVNSVLFLWVTSPLLAECWDVIKAWGFEYKTSFIWDKIQHNYGHYNSVRHELLLVCTKGSFLPQNNKLHDSVVSIERSSKHSEKPEYFRQLIEKMYPEGKRIELFARGKTKKGWTAWGNECIMRE